MNSSSLDNNMSSQNLWGKNKETFINGKTFQKPKSKSESEDKTPVYINAYRRPRFEESCNIIAAL